MGTEVHKGQDEAYLHDEKMVNEYFHNIHVNKAKLSSKGLLFDVLNQVSYIKDPGLFRLMEKLVFLYMWSYTRIVPVNPVDHEVTMKRIFAELKEHSILVFSNHVTYVSLPLLVRELINRGLHHGSPEVRDHIYTVLGPLLMTHKKYKDVVLSVSHAIKTLPDTGNIPPLSPGAAYGHKKLFLSELGGILDVPGNIVIMSPTGERDVTTRNEDGTVDHIYFVDDEKIKTRIALAQKIVDKGHMLVFSAMNEANLKHPFVVPYQGGQWTPGNSFLNLKIVGKDEFTLLHKEGRVMSTLASLVQDKDGRILGETLPKNEFDHLKKTLDTSHLLGKKRVSDFDDTLGKATLRQLFKLFM